jgi:hypothetical protein
MEFEIAGESSASDRAAPRVTVLNVGDGYFETLQVPLTRGRSFTARDGREGPQSAIVNQRLVDMFFGARDPLGQLIRVSRPGTANAAPWARIVGVSPTVRQTGGNIPDPVVYLPNRWSTSTTAAILVRTEGAPDLVAPAVRQVLHRLDPNLPLYRVMSLRRAMDEAGWNGRMAAVTAQSVAIIALFMALVGLHAVTAHAVHWWSGELGLRIALGASGWNVAWIVVRRVLIQLGAGVTLGLLAALAFDRAFNEPVDQAAASVSMMAPGVLALICLSIVAVAVVACLAPLRRAARVDPIDVLRTS